MTECKIAWCDRRVNRQGMCSRHYNEWRFLHPPQFEPGSFIDRFRDKVAVGAPGDCWPWRGTISPNGYGVIAISYNGMKGRSYLAHRLALALAVGEQPDRYALHSCDRRDCCNPAHLRWGTHEENMHDMVERGRARAGRYIGDVCKEGHPISGENIRFIHRGDKTYRACRTCINTQQRNRHARRKAS